MDVMALVERQKQRTQGRIVQYKGSTIEGVCIKGSAAEKLLALHDMMRTTLEVPEWQRFQVAYILNGDKKYCLTDDIEAVLQSFHQLENVDAALFIESASKRIWCAHGSWLTLGDEDGLLSDLIEPQRKKQKVVDSRMDSL